MEAKFHLVLGDHEPVRVSVNREPGYHAIRLQDENDKIILDLLPEEADRLADCLKALTAIIQRSQ